MGRSVRSSGAPNASSPLSRIAQEKWQAQVQMKNQVGLNFLSHGNGNKIEFPISKI
jgi:hypothetical protein